MVKTLESTRHKERAQSSASSEVEAEGLAKRLGGSQVLQDLSFRILPGQLFTLLGPSGCGKTTALRILAGLETPDSGDVLVDGENVTDKAPFKRDIGFVPQDYALWPHMTARKHITFGLKRRGLSRQDIRQRSEWALELVDLLPKAGRRPSQLSGGEQQRVALARAIALEPRVLLLDEPLSNLDRRLRDEMRLEVRRLQQRLQITSVFVTHDQLEALAMSDMMAILKDGKIEQVGTPQEIYEQPQTPFAAGFLGEANLLPVRVTSYQGEQEVVAETGGHQLSVPVIGAMPTLGENLLLAVRPENVTVETDPAPSGRLPATLVSKTYEGGSTKAQLEYEGTRLGAAIPSDQTPPEGSDVWLGFKRAAFVPSE